MPKKHDVRIPIMCPCKTTSREERIDSVCIEINDLDLDRRWATYLDTIDARHHRAGYRWTFTRTDSEVWFRRVLQNMTDDELADWMHAQSFCTPGV